MSAVMASFACLLAAFMAWYFLLEIGVESGDDERVAQEFSPAL